MDINDLREEATRVWVAYGKSIAKAFGFRGDIEAGPLLLAIKENDEENIKAFILEVKELTGRMDEMRERFLM